MAEWTDRTTETAPADVAVVGAGPAGLSAAVVAAEHGLRVVLIDAGRQTGGQYWRHPDERHRDAFTAPESTGHHHWRHYTDLRDRLSAAVASGRLRHLAGRQVWRTDGYGDRVALRTSAVSGTDTLPHAERTTWARRLVIATGAYDRQLPVPGWTLPGVMAAGGVQAMLKANQVRAGRRAVVAGTGPFLLSVAAGLAEAGVEVVEVVDANALTRWAATPLRALQEPGKLWEGVGYATTFLRHRVPFRTRTVISAVRGSGRVSEVELSRVDGEGRIRPGSSRTVAADLVAFGWGFTPQLELAVGLGLRTRIDVDGSLVIDVDDDLRASDPLVFAAGEVTGISGAVASCAEGELVGSAVARDLGAPTDARTMARHRRRLQRGRRFAIGMHRASPVPAAWDRWLTPETHICRCEEVTAAEVTDAVDALRADDARDVRVTARPGMGLCQGRVCGFALSKLVATGTGGDVDAAALESLTNRQVGVPVSLGDLASLVPHHPNQEES
ncbi:NADP-dependent aldehyde dehydrogenase [Microbacterium foliorum]|uniref:NAD(P)/FAD-dependent oxidoreductase n=1 Tax=Microbacterium foliorum TaxID=104336 RepID=UPI00209F403D|nr:NAD(P)/FAD-dependent oxidoreductase [Microbacterium foliorum]MCP1428563.1 NADP-dependent aldehyde dehydrogenase [Microbacterium foliorum]